MKVTRDLRDQREREVPLVQLELKAKWVKLDHLDPLEQMVIEDLEERMVSRVRRVTLVTQDREGQQESAV